MKKIHLLTLIVVILLALMGADYFLNTPSPPRAARDPAVPANGSSAVYPNFTQRLLTNVGALADYRLVRRSRAQHLFEKVTFTPEDLFATFYNFIQGAGEDVMEVYEVHGPSGQGNLTYYTIKQRFMDQVIDATAHVNEVGNYGHNSFFYNDLNYPQTAFMVVQAGDTVYGFKYLKEPADQFQAIQQAIQYLMAN